MTEHTQRDLKVCIDFTENCKMIEEHFGCATVSSNYNARIISNHRKPEYINLLIFYDPSELLLEKFQHLRENRVDVLKCIKSLPIQKPWFFPNFLDFSNSRLLNIEESHNWEHDKEPIVFIIDNLDMLDSARYGRGDACFQLTENALQHLHEYVHYGQLGSYSIYDRFISSSDNRIVAFGSIQLTLSFNHDYANYTKYKFEIHRDAYLMITDNNNRLNDTDLIDVANLLCTLISFYWEKSIDFFIAHVRVLDNDYRTRVINKYSNHYSDESMESSLKSQYKTVYDFIESLNYKKTLDCQSFLEEIVPRIIRTKIIDEISQFMLLYNIIEKIRNYCMDTGLSGSKLEIREEFKFTEGKKATYKFKKKIDEISEIIDPSDIDDYLAKTSEKVNFIKKTGLINQFDSLVTYLGLDQGTYDLDYSSLIKVRNDIYHGKSPREKVIPFNIKMKSLINDLVLRLIQ